ncbi:MAG TPA: Ig-like domain-containing protein [bacterium]|mgnify:CR=1 FL=1|nr:Ig-like domain-containing protein [bacterium]
MLHRYGHRVHFLFFFFLATAWCQAAGLKLQWLANSEADLAGYKVHVGTKSRVYTKTIDVGPATNTVIQDLSEGTPYFLCVTAYDRAGNESSFSQEINLTLGDGQAPALSSVTPLSRTELLLVFSEPIDPGSATDPAHYRIEPAIAVQSVKLQSDGKTVLITTAEHAAGSTYTLSVHDVADRALPANVIAAGTQITYALGVEDSDTTPPVLNLATLESATRLQLYFSEPLEETGAETIGCYSLSDGVQVRGVMLSEDGRRVQLTTSEHVGGIAYRVTVTQVTDRSSRKNKIPDGSSYTYQYDPGDVTGPVMTLVNAVARDRVEIMFNEPVDEASAETISHYQISGGVQVASAELDPSGQVLRLQTSDHSANQLYVLTVAGVCDRSDRKNPIASGSPFSYLFVPADELGPTIAKVVITDFTHVLVTFSEQVDARYAEEPGNYQISNNVRVYSANLTADGKSVQLETTPHVSGQLYVLQISHVRDVSGQGNPIALNSSYAYVYDVTEANAGPTIVEVKPMTATTLQVVFSKPVEKASSQAVANYVLNRGAAVKSAALDESGTRVLLQTTVHEPNKIYLLTISNIFDATGQRNLIQPNSSYSYVYEAADAVGPVITLVKVIDGQNLDVLFNERVTAASANQASNYSISGGVEVQSASLDASRSIVHLHTSAHQAQKLYVLRINAVKDESAGNVIAVNSSYSYLYEPSDGLAPTIASVRVKDIQHLEVVFSETVEPVTALDPDHYSLNHSAEIKSVKAGSAGHAVELETSVLQPGRIYVITVNQVMDGMGNRIAANSAYTFTFGDWTLERTPAVTHVYSSTPTELWVVFDMKVDKTQAENPAHYTIQGPVAVQSAKLDGSQTQVQLRTSSHVPGRIYSLIVNDIPRWDRPDLLIKANVPFFYTLQQDESAAPKLSKVEIEGENLIRVTFSQAVEKISAETRRNYTISENLAVLSAEWQSEPNQVLLETARHQSGKAYTLTVSGIKSTAAGAAMGPAVMAYTYMPTLEIKVDGVAEAMISYADVGRLYYVDRNYVITSVPKDLLQAKLIMTANNDRTMSDNRFMVIQLSKSALVYVAYDDEAQSAPNWLDAHFQKTEQFLGVSESGDRLRLWEGYFPSGRLVLGGNAAVGSRGAQMMYVVLIRESEVPSSLGGGYTEGGAQPSTLPESVNLLSNYPNPFNPITTIRFDLPYEKEVQIAVYDLLGRRVRLLYHGNAAAGQHTVVWDGKNEQHIPVAAGIYFYHMDAWENGTRNGLNYKVNYQSFTRKMTLLK